MTHPAATRAVDLAVEAIRAATRAIVQAAELGEAEAIDRAVDRRTCAVEQLEQALEQHPDALGTAVVEQLAMQANDAETALRSLTGTCRQQLKAVAGGVQIIRGYASYARDSSSLDRSG